MAKHIAWDEKYKVGHQLIDSQHKRLFEIAEELYRLTLESEEKQNSDVSLVLQDCTKYVAFHFSCEEELMQKSSFADAEAHIQQHKEFTTYVASLMGEFSRGNRVELEKLYSFISEWLVRHICTEDKKLASHANNA